MAITVELSDGLICALKNYFISTNFLGKFVGLLVFFFFFFSCYGIANFIIFSLPPPKKHCFCCCFQNKGNKIYITILKYLIIIYKMTFFYC